MNNRYVQKEVFPDTKKGAVGNAVIVCLFFLLAADSAIADKGMGFYTDIIRLDNAATMVYQNYDEIKSEDLVDNAIHGMLEILDPHSAYYKEKAFEDLRRHTEGKYGGLGLQISICNGMLTVMTPVFNTPGERMGIKTGDQILNIDGISTTGLTAEEAAERLRGEPGSDVTLTIRRRGEAHDLDYVITREIISIKSVDYSGVIKNRIGYIRLVSFSQETDDEMEKALRSLLKHGIKGLILDLRSNPGGLLTQAIEVAEKFLAKKSLVVSTRGRVKNQNKEFFASDNPTVPNTIPLVVLVNRGSASASEIVAGAIQDWDRGVIVGDTTFGKGSVQSILPLDGEHYLKLTTAFYYTPSGRCINRPENGVRGISRDTNAVRVKGDGKDMNPDSKKGTVQIQGMKVPVKAKDEDADQVIYRTKSGRIIYGGGGIVPDSLLKDEGGSIVMRALESRDLFFQFANLKYPRMQARKVSFDSTFTVDEKLLDDFYAFIDTVTPRFEIKSYAAIKYDEFTDAAGLSADTVGSLMQKRHFTPAWKEKERGTLKKYTAFIEELLKREQKRTLVRAENEIKGKIFMAFLRREYGTYNPYVQKVLYENDKQVLAATAILNNKKVYAELLQSVKKAPKISLRD